MDRLIEMAKKLDDIHNLYFDVYGDLFGDKATKEAPPFAHRIHYTTHPIYMQNYFMGEVTCDMLRKVFCKKHDIN